MDIITINGKTYGVVVSQDEYGAEIGLWLGDEQVASIMIDEDGIATQKDL